MPRTRRVRDPLVVSGVIGDVIDPFHASVPLGVFFATNQLTNGCNMRPSVVVNKPRVDVGGEEDLDIFYTLVMVDPDAPSPSNAHHKEYLHWMVTDIQASTSATSGAEVVCYESPQPLLGIHRFVFVLFRQLGMQTVYPPGWRLHFNTKIFAALHHLGLPVASVYFNCQKETGTGGRRFNSI